MAKTNRCPFCGSYTKYGERCSCDIDAPALPEDPSKKVVRVIETTCLTAFVYADGSIKIGGIPQ